MMSMTFSTSWGAVQAMFPAGASLCVTISFAITANDMKKPCRSWCKVCCDRQELVISVSPTPLLRPNFMVSNLLLDLQVHSQTVITGSSRSRWQSMNFQKMRPKCHF